MCCKSGHQIVVSSQRQGWLTVLCSASAGVQWMQIPQEGLDSLSRCVRWWELNWGLLGSWTGMTVCWLFPQFAFITFALHPMISSHPVQMLNGNSANHYSSHPLSCCFPRTILTALPVLLHASHCPTLGITITVRNIYRKKKKKNEDRISTI